MNWLDWPNSPTITNKLITNQTYAVETVSYQGVVKLEGANVVSWNVSRRQRFWYLSHDAALICRPLKTRSLTSQQAPQPLYNSLKHVDKYNTH